MASLVVLLLLLAVGPAQDKRVGETADDLKRLGEIATDLSDVQTRIRRAKLDIDQVDLAEQILLNERLRVDQQSHRLRGQMVLVETKVNLLREDPLNDAPDIKVEIQRLTTALKVTRAAFDAHVTGLRIEIRRNNPQFQTKRKAAKKEIECLRKIETRLSAELDRCVIGTGK